MIHALRLTPFGQVPTEQFPEILRQADLGADELGAFMDELRDEGGPLDFALVKADAELAKALAALGEDKDLPAGDPRLVRVRTLTEANLIHYPDLERRAAGTFAVELDATDRNELNLALARVVNAVAAVRGESGEVASKFLLGRNALPSFTGPSTLTLVQESIRIENLLDTYETDVLGRTKPKGPRTLIIVGGIVLGLLGLSAIVYATRKKGGQRK